MRRLMEPRPTCEGLESYPRLHLYAGANGDGHISAAFELMVVCRVREAAAGKR